MRPCPTAEAACSSSTTRGRPSRPSRWMPRAIAPEVTTTTSTPPACSPATSSQIRATTDNRSAPESSATIDDPSLTTATGTSGGIQLEDDAADLDVVAGLEPRPLERADHAHAPQAVLDERLRLLVLEIPAG